MRKYLFTLLFILQNNFFGVAQTVVNGSFEQWGVVNTCDINLPPDSWLDYSNGGIGADEANFLICSTTIPPNASDSNVYARCYTGSVTTGEGMYQMVSGFLPGNVYHISYDYAGSNLYGGTGDSQWHILIDDIDSNASPVFNSLTAFWTPHTYSFTASAATHKIGLRLLWVGGSSNGSGAIDNFVIVSDSSVLPIPVSNFLASDSSVCANSCISFSDFSTNATSWQWNFFGGNPPSSTNQNPQNICYDNPGTYDVTLISANSSGSDTLTFSNYVTVFPLPVVPSITQSGDTLFSSTGYTTYQWYIGSDTITGATNYFYLATQSGNYNLVVSDENGCSVGAGIVNVIAGTKELGIGNQELKVYPNPACNMLYVTCYTLYGSEIIFEMNNAIGEKIYFSKEKNVSEKFSKEISLKDFADGIYLLKILSKEKYQTTKIVIKH